ncbi:hypothetical protein DFH09DRAFT_1117241 [Mycena vulgaris]|nr:hypothetical protein DFH09DRAFT_1117241 [Mycena vulgaris]
MSPRRYKQYLRRHRFSILVHGTEAEHPVHLRVCRETPLISIGIHLWRQGYLPSHFTSSVHPSTRKSFLLRKMQWSDTVGDHDLGTLSSITLSVSLLGGASGGNEPGPSRPDRGKAKNFSTALKDGAAEPEPTKRKRKRSGRTSQASATKDQDGNASGSSDDGGAYDAEAGAQDEGEEPEDSDGDMVVDGAELAETLSAKTDPKAGKTRSKDTGKGKGKAKPTRKPAAKKSKTQPPSSFYWACSTDLLQDDSEEETDAPKTVKKAPRRARVKPARSGGSFTRSTTSKMRNRTRTILSGISATIPLGLQPVPVLDGSTGGTDGFLPARPDLDPPDLDGTGAGRVDPSTGTRPRPFDGFGRVTFRHKMTRWRRRPPEISTHNPHVSV